MKLLKTFIVLTIPFAYCAMHGASSSSSNSELTPTWFNLPVPEMTPAPTGSAVISQWPHRIAGFIAPTVAGATLIGGAAYLKHKGLINCSTQKTLTLAALPTLIAGLVAAAKYDTEQTELSRYSPVYSDVYRLEYNWNPNTIITTHAAVQQTVRQNIEQLNQNSTEAADAIIHQITTTGYNYCSAITNELNTTIGEMQMKIDKLRIQMKLNELIAHKIDEWKVEAKFRRQQYTEHEQLKKCLVNGHPNPLEGTKQLILEYVSLNQEPEIKTPLWSGLPHNITHLAYRINNQFQEFDTPEAQIAALENLQEQIIPVKMDFVERLKTHYNAAFNTAKNAAAKTASDPIDKFNNDVEKISERTRSTGRITGLFYGSAFVTIAATATLVWSWWTS